MPEFRTVTRFCLCLTLCLLGVMTSLVYAEPLHEFDRAVAVSDLARARTVLDGLPMGVPRRLAEAELALLGQRPALAWSRLAAISVKDVPPPLASRYFRLRGKLEMSLHPDLARRDLKESLARADTPAEVAATHLATLEYWLEWEQPFQAQLELRALLMLADQQRSARQGAALLASADGQPEQAILAWQSLAKDAEHDSAPLLALTYSLQEATCWDLLEQRRRASTLRRACVNRALALKQPQLAALAARTLLPVEPRVEQVAAENRTFVQDFLSKLPKVPERVLLLAQLGSAAPVTLGLLRQATEESQAFDPLVQAYARFHHGVALKSVDWRSALTEFKTALELLVSYQDGWLSSDRWSVDRIRLHQQLASAYRGNGDAERATQSDEEARRLSEEYAPIAVSQETLRQQLLSAIQRLDVADCRAIWERVLADFDRAKPSELVRLLPEVASAFSVAYSSLDDEMIGYNHWRPTGPLERDLAERLRSRPGLIGRFLSSCDQATAQAQRRGDESARSDIWYHRARALSFLGQYAEAERALKEAEVALHPPTQPRRLRILISRGTVLARTGDLASQLDALEREAEAVDSDAFQKRYIRLLLAKEALSMGRYQKSLELVDRALTAGASSPAILLKAQALAGLGRPAEAITLLRAQTPYTKVMQQLSLLLAQTRRIREALLLNDNVLADSSTDDSPLATAAALLDRVEIQGQGKGAIADHRAALHEFLRVRSQLDPLLAKDLFTSSAVGRRLWKLLTTAEKQSLSQPTSGSASDPRSGQHETAETKERTAYRGALESLRTQWPSNQDLIDLQAWDIEAASGQLEEKTVLLHPIVLEQGVAWVYLTSESYGLKLAPLSASDLDRRVRALLAAAESPNTELGYVRDLSRSLAHSLLEPIAGVTHDRTHLVLVPTGSLALLPFEMLVDERGHYLVERFEISYRERLASEPQSLQPLAGTKLLVYDDASGLAGAKAEAKAVEDLLSPETLNSQNWSSETFRRLARTASLIHISAHGLSSAGDAVSELSMGQVGVTRDDIRRLQLPSGSLVVLGACSGARPNVEAGRRKGSLLAAFLTVGAGAAVGAYWEVDDRSASDFFQSFYQRLLKGECPEVALTELKRSWLRDPARSHPFYWAPYVLYR